MLFVSVLDGHWEVLEVCLIWVCWAWLAEGIFCVCGVFLLFCAGSTLPFCVDPVDVNLERRSKVKLLMLQGQSRAMCIVHNFGFGENGIVSPW